MNGRIVAGALVVLGCLGRSVPAAADSEPAGVPAWVREVTLHGFLSASYSYNFNRPPSATNQFRVFDFDDNTFKVDELELVALKDAAKPGEAGFRADLTLGSSVPRVTASAGLFRDETGEAEDIDLHQAYVSYVARIGSGFRVDFGKFVTGSGYEVIDGYDGWNDNATRSFLFGYAIPFTHLGLRAGYHFGESVSASAMVVNGWDVAKDNNSSKTVGGQFAWAPSTSVSLTATGITGPERAGDNSHTRSLLDLVAIVKPGRFTLGANGDWGTEAEAAGPGRDGTWKGGALYARYPFGGGYALAARAEYFQDLEGVRTGVSQKLRELSLTPEKSFAGSFYLRADLRFDHSDQMVFESAEGAKNTQSTVLLEAFYTF